MKHYIAVSAITALSALFVLTGCTHAAVPPGQVAAQQAITPRAVAPARPTLSAMELASIHPNEAGVIPILEYHHIDNGRTTYSRTAAKFQGDLERLYRENYRPISLKDYLDNRIDAPAGMTPVIFTFDDAIESQFRYLPDGKVDPKCAVGMLQSFHAQHPDWPLKGTFFILPESAFGQPALRKKKLAELLALGFELGNHTINHPRLKDLSDEQVQHEIGGCAKELHDLAPTAHVDVIALPFGIAPRNRKLLAEGEFDGVRYTNRAAMLVGAEPAPSPVSKKFKPMKIPRIQAFDGPWYTSYWLDILAKHPKRRYISDGDPQVISVPKSLSGMVDQNRLNGATLRLY